MGTAESTVTDPSQDWRNWHEERTGTVSAPYGPLSLTGTHWLDEAVEGRIPDVPGRWSDGGDEIVLTATATDELALDGEEFTGEARLRADSGAVTASRLTQAGRRLAVLRREGLWAVRVWDPQSAARRSFGGIEATPYDEKWALPGLFRPYGESRTVRVPNADGRDRGLALGGELAFSVDGDEHTLQVAVEEDGSLWAVFADTTSGTSSHRFRFLRTAPPAPDGKVLADFNRALLPPCAFAAHFLCPFPPPGNTLPVDVTAGERSVRIR
jgi:uncharacterized protein (DUF1684 family)